MNDRRRCAYRELDAWHEGHCLLITGGMLAEPSAVIERHDGTVTIVPAKHIQFLDTAEKDMAEATATTGK